MSTKRVNKSIRPKRAMSLVVAGLTAGSLLLAGCSGGGASGPEAPSESYGKPSDEPVTIKVDSFGGIFANFDKAGLLDDYKELHPNVTIEYNEVQQEDDYWTALATKLNSGSGLADIQAIEISRVALVTQEQQDKWVDMRATAEADHTKNYPPAKAGAITTEDGAVLGFGTDAGPMAMCFRSDKLEEAGLPSTGEKLAEKITDWDSYESVGQQYKDKTGDAWMDSSGGYYRLLTSVEPVRNYNEEGDPTWDTNDTVQSSFMRAAEAGANDLTAKLPQFSPEWNTAMSTGNFATIACPAWMLGYIKQQAGEKNAGNWDVMPLPQNMGGNWGGSYLSIPKTSEKVEAAAQLAAFLTNAESETKEFEAGLAFPSNSGALEQITDTKDKYFSNAPIGQIFTDSYKAAPDQPLGIDDGAIDIALGEALTSVENNDVKPQKAWEDAKASIEDQIG